MRIDKIDTLLKTLRLPAIDFEELYKEKNTLTPLESIEIFLEEQQRLRTEKQKIIRRKRAKLPVEKTIEDFDFGFQRSVPKEQMLRLSDMTWIEQAYNICFLGPPGIGKTHLALALATKALDMGYAIAFNTLDELIKILKTSEISATSGAVLR